MITDINKEIKQLKLGAHNEDYPAHDAMDLQQNRRNESKDKYYNMKKILVMKARKTQTEILGTSGMVANTFNLLSFTI